MCLLFETIKINNGIPHNLHYHSERMKNARKLLFNSKDSIDLSMILKIPENCLSGIYKCRVEYNDNIVKTEILPYTFREIKTLQIIHDDNISYRFKYSDRSCFDELKKNSDADEILIVKNGWITDTSFSNIIFFDGANWITPANPLLEGTKRKELIDRKIISEQKIKLSDLRKYKMAKLINAMIDIEDSEEIEIKDIIEA
jgi:4-amino-4-deoxychorismate lyase